MENCRFIGKLLLRNLFFFVRFTVAHHYHLVYLSRSFYSVAQFVP